MNKYHELSDEWSLESNGDQLLPLRVLYNYIHITDIEPTIVSFDIIAHKPLPLTDNPRYEAADIAYPGIIVEHMDNPLNKQYRLIDGRHRILKQMNDNFTQGLFYIIPINVIYKFIIDK